VAQHDHPLARIQELLRRGLELVPMLRYRPKDVVGDGFGAVVGTPGWCSLHIGLLPYYFWVHEAHDGLDVGPVERLVPLAHDVHVLFGHAFFSSFPTRFPGGFYLSHRKHDAIERNPLRTSENPLSTSLGE
jgi:hypothetical protein